ncbi:MAG: hypothetical protein ACC662_10905, partial [Planctomycetota bacterium]
MMVRQRVQALAQQHHQRIGETRGLLVSANTRRSPCPSCGDAMVVEKTFRRHVATLAHGSLEVREIVLVCGKGCRHEDGSLVRRRSEDVGPHVPPGGVFGYDVIVHVGLQRFLFHRQREEIRRGLEEEHGITASTGALSTMQRSFLTHLEALHLARAPVLAKALASDGGWPLHVDATGEDGRGTLLVLLAGWRRWVLASFKIPTERADQVLPCLHQVADRFGNPCAVMRDLGRAMIPAVADFVEERGLSIPALSCHFHFLQDVGKDLLVAAYGTLREMLRRTGLRSRLRTLARDLGREIGPEIDRAREALEQWKIQSDGGHQLPEDPTAAQAVVRGLTQWVLDFPAQSTDRRFPFDRPLLDLYDRCVTAARATDAFLRNPPQDPTARRVLRRLSRALDLVASSEPMVNVIASLRMRAALFDELRATIRLCPSSPTVHETVATPGELHDIQQELEAWERGLRARRPARGPAEDRRKAIDLVLAHLHRHGDSLFGHVIHLPARAGGGVRTVARTNNVEETYFRDMKHQERRRSGRKILTQDFERLPPAAALVPNLLKPDYVALLCGSLENLPTAFAELDAERRKAMARARPSQHTGTP